MVANTVFTVSCQKEVDEKLNKTMTTKVMAPPIISKNLMITPIRCIKMVSVSYTHLDVYKRQLFYHGLINNSLRFFSRHHATAHDRFRKLLIFTNIFLYLCLIFVIHQLPVCISIRRLDLIKHAFFLSVLVRSCLLYTSRCV